LPSSLTRVLPFAFIFSIRLPVSVWGTGGRPHRSGAFSRPLGLSTSCLAARHHGLTTACHRLSTRRLAYPRACTFAPPSGTGLLTGCPSPALSSLGLGPTNPTRTDLPSEPLDSRRTRFSHVVRYSCQHSHSPALQRPFQVAFTALGTLPYLACIAAR
jgi:hypothetical protein